jgi:hypothetical protein
LRGGEQLPNYADRIIFHARNPVSSVLSDALGPEAFVDEKSHGNYRLHHAPLPAEKEDITKAEHTDSIPGKHSSCICIYGRVASIKRVKNSKGSRRRF